MERFVGYASGVVKRSRQGINRGRFVTCWKLGVVILPFALPGFPTFTRIDTMHCMTKVRTKWHQRSAPIHKLMMLFSWNRHQPLQIYFKSVESLVWWLPLHPSWVFILIGAIWHSYDGPYNGRRERLHLQHTICSIFTTIHFCIHPEHGHPQVSQCHCWNGHSQLLSLWEYSRCSCWVVKV